MITTENDIAEKIISKNFGFDGNSLVKLENNQESKVCDLKKGDLILGGFKVKCIFKTLVNDKINVVDINSLLISPNTPVYIDGEWDYPKSLFLSRLVHIDYLYNIILETGHVLILNNIHVMTPGFDSSDSSIDFKEYKVFNKILNNNINHENEIVDLNL